MLQLALLRLCRHWPVEHPPAYLRRTLVNLCRDRGRRRHLVPEPAEAREDQVGGMPDPADAHASQEALEHLLSALPARQRAAVVLRVQEQLDEIAQRLNNRPRKTLGFMTPSRKLSGAVAVTP